MAENDLLCGGKTLDGGRCTRHRTPGEETCRWHRPESIEERARKLEEKAAQVRATAAATTAVPA